MNLLNTVEFRVSVMHDPIMMTRMWNLDTSAAYIFSESAVQTIMLKERIRKRFHRLDGVFGKYIIVKLSSFTCGYNQ